MWKKKEKKREEKEEDLLKELCGDDAKLYDFLGRTLYLDPMAAISKKDLELLIEEAEKSIKDGNYEEAIRKYRVVVEKAIFEATQNPEERGRYIKVIQDLASKIMHATEKAKEKAEKEGLTDHAASLEKNIEHYKFVSKRIDDVVNVAAHFYNEKLAMLGDVDRREARREKIRAMETEATRESRGEAERREARREVRKEMGSEARREAEKEEKRVEERGEEQREARREKIRAMEGEEIQEALGDKERQQARRKKRREARRKELE
ncbi:MAG: hypothetical protein OEX77_09235 [Candidatus Bathyarchaeota archaeon]|nr:hypothetical protein [Candidatus Bathyarchaeota archaeon]